MVDLVAAVEVDHLPLYAVVVAVYRDLEVVQPRHIFAELTGLKVELAVFDRLVLLLSRRRQNLVLQRFTAEIMLRCRW